MNNKEVLIENLKLIYGTSFNYNGAKTYYDKKKEEEGFNRSSCSGKNSIKSIKDILSLLEYNEKEKQAVYLSHYSFTNPEEPETTAIFNCLYLDFDLNDKNLLLAEEVITKQELEKLSVEEINNLVSEVETEEKQKLQGLTIEEKRKYFHNKFTSTKYLEAPFNEAKKVAAILENGGLKPLTFFSGSKGFHILVKFNPVDVANLNEVAESLGTNIKESLDLTTLDSSVIKHTTQRVIRIPYSMHQKTGFFKNPIDLNKDYFEIIDSCLEREYKLLPDITQDSSYFESKLKFLDDSITKEKKQRLEEESDFLPSTRYVSNNRDILKDKTFQKNYKKLLKDGNKWYMVFSLIHLAKRTGIAKNDVIQFFKDINLYDKNIETEIKRISKVNLQDSNLRVVGLKTFLKYVKEYAPEEEKNYLIKYFNSCFRYKEKPVENTLEETLTINGKEYKIIHSKTSKEEYYTIKDFLLKDHMLKIDKKKGMIQYKQDKKIISKLDLKAASGIQPKNKDLPDKFKDRIIKKTSLEEFPVEELIEELDYLFLFLEENEEDPVEIPEEKTDHDILHFGTEYIQTDKGIFKINISKTGNETKEPIANMIIKDVKITLDSLNIKEPVYTVTYYNRTFNKEKTVEHYTRKQLTEEFIKANVFYVSTKENVETVINTFIINGTQEGRIETNEEAYLEGFFLNNGKITENTNIKHIKKDYNELAEAITLFNEIMQDRTPEGKANDCSVYRFMLWNPFSYVFKQLGIAEASNYGLILTGKSQANKSGSIRIGERFYNRLNEEKDVGDTVSVLGSRLGESTFSSIFEECYDLLKQSEAMNVSKRSMYQTYVRATKNRADNSIIEYFPCLNIPTYLLNEGQQLEFKDYITNRFKIIDYTSKSVIETEDKKKFIKKYLPKVEDSPLNKLSMIGRFFSDKLIAIIEAKDISRLTNIEKTTIEILKEMAEETSAATGKEISFLPEMYTITEASTNYDYDVKRAVTNLFNEEFKKKNRIAANNKVNSGMFVESIANNDFDFITYNRHTSKRTAKHEFIVNASGITKYVNKNIEELLELETILDYLGLTEVLKEKQKEEGNTKPFERYIRTQHNIKVGSGKTAKQKNITGFHLTTDELMLYLFNFNVEFSDVEAKPMLKKEDKTFKSKKKRN